MDEDHEFSDLWKKWSDLGMAMLHTEEYGGSDLDPVTYILALEEVARPPILSRLFGKSTY